MIPKKRGKAVIDCFATRTAGGIPRSNPLKKNGSLFNPKSEQYVRLTLCISHEG